MQVLTYLLFSGVATSSDETKRRLLDAARDEFAVRGIAGARTGRIAQAAGANEALLFRYFGSKRKLFEQVYEELVVQTIDDVPIDASDLGAYAGALFDYYRKNDQVLRLASWVALEDSEAAVAPTVTESTGRKVSAIEDAQRVGLVSTRFTAPELLALVMQISVTGAQGAPTVGFAAGSEIHRTTVVAAVTMLASPAAQDAPAPASTP